MILFIEPVLDNINIPNNVYSTNIFAIHHVAKHILGIKDLDKRLKSGDIELVRELGEVTIGGKEKYFTLLQLNIVVISIQLLSQFMIAMWSKFSLF